MTGKEAILEAAKGVPLDDALRIAEAVEALGFVCVPKEPTKKMLKSAWADALAEDAAGVWRCMIEEATASEIPQ